MNQMLAYDVHLIQVETSLARDLVTTGKAGQGPECSNPERTCAETFPRKRPLSRICGKLPQSLWKSCGKRDSRESRAPLTCFATLEYDLKSSLTFGDVHHPDVASILFPSEVQMRIGDGEAVGTEVAALSFQVGHAVLDSTGG